MSIRDKTLIVPWTIRHLRGIYNNNKNGGVLK